MPSIVRTPFVCAAGACAHAIGLHTGPPDDNGAHDATEPGPGLLHVFVAPAGLIANPALQWYVAVVGDVALYANEFSEYVTYPLSSTKRSHCAGLHSADAAFQENPSPQSDV